MADPGEVDQPSDRGATARTAKNQKRIDSILIQIAETREQLIAAVEDLGPAFGETAIQAAATSDDPRERNKVATVERAVDVLINQFEELASRALKAAREQGGEIGRETGSWERLADIKVISKASAGRLRDAREIRNELTHAYPPDSWRGLLEAADLLLEEADRYPVKVDRWLDRAGTRRAAARSRAAEPG